ncbi:hypothetical protein [Vibrio sonorensis]|uniref:hypothetical protein n=1 Tax=Vibrio sonorensis TaxID=1004316 RepID=UPI0008D95AF2|nr:hypothetical protein [Vibrio sonorensis]
MIAVYRDYLLQDSTHSQVHVKVNPVGMIDVEIEKSRQHHLSDFDQLCFVKRGSQTRLTGQDNTDTWQLVLSNRDADELGRLIEEACEEYEILMRDL